MGGLQNFDGDDLVVLICSFIYRSTISCKKKKGTRIRVRGEVREGWNNKMRVRLSEGDNKGNIENGGRKVRVTGRDTDAEFLFKVEVRKFNLPVIVMGLQ